MENCTVGDLGRMAFDKTIKPLIFFDGISGISVADWTELSLAFVNWLILNGHLKKEKLPIPNYANRGKYFINSNPCHEYPKKDGSWHRIGGFHIDTKYNAQDHIKNIISTVNFLGVYHPKFRITFS